MCGFIIWSEMGSTDCVSGVRYFLLADDARNCPIFMGMPRDSESRFMIAF